ncbi:hypothetical protein [uncultured Draconibacterium sp.]|uniref:hypothetical protein n=1 Tax=uncultured Draconibacterium sp. TaxID=1573823 RepID=UPI0029C903E1|nr:hypothetical protein [uncultured Draconibacterium sp.]
MKNKVNKNRLPELDKFDRKQKKHAGSRDKSSKRRLTIYDEFDDEDLPDYSSDIEEEEE